MPLKGKFEVVKDHMSIEVKYTISDDEAGKTLKDLFDLFVTLPQLHRNKGVENAFYILNNDRRRTGEVTVKKGQKIRIDADHLQQNRNIPKSVHDEIAEIEREELKKEEEEIMKHHQKQ